MRQRIFPCVTLVAFAALLAGSVGWPTAADAQTFGRARAVRAIVLGSTTVLADTGPLAGADDALRASRITGAVSSLLNAEVLHAATVGGPDQTAAEASLADLGLTVGGTGVSAAFVMARALAAADGDGGDSTIEGLEINGVPIAVTGEPNQTIPILGGRVIINEQRLSPGAITVNALRVVVDGVADVVIASATAGF
jgi:hypothetical protein